MLFLLGGTGYVLMELLYRGRSHYSMFLAGGVCFLLLGKLEEAEPRLLDKEVVVQGNPRVYKALRDQLATVLAELRHMEDGTAPDGDMLETIQLIANIMDGMKEGNAYGA